MSDMTEQFDVIIVGAGISGIGAAYHLKQQCPAKSYVVIESMDDFGGTWRTHTYPGIRSDSDLYTFGYRFKPWTSAPIATGEEILKYVGDVIDENDLAPSIRYGHQVESARWSAQDASWTLEGTVEGDPFAISGKFLWMCQGYYRHSEGYTPEWPGMDRYEGQIVHPQTWPDDLDYVDKNVVVIGSGATAATLIPAMVNDVAHITMLQRSPTYFAVGKNRNEVADMLRELEIDETWIHEIARRKVLHDQAAVTRLSFEHPDMLKKELFNSITEILGDDYDLEPHFTPSYRPWQQRLALVPDGDLFHGIASGKASVVTDEIEAFTEKGIQLKSGDHLEADIIVTATGFNMSVLGDIDFSIDGAPLDFSDRVGYRGMMFTDIPNMAWVFGYFRASWTLRAELVADFVCRLLHHMDDLEAAIVTPKLRQGDEAMVLGPWVDPDNFNPGYLERALHLMPRSGDRQPWLHSQDYWSERTEFPEADLDDGCLVYD